MRTLTSSLFTFPDGLTLWVRALYQLLSSTASSTSYHQRHEDIMAEYDIIKNCQQNPKYFAPLYTRYYDQIFIFIYKRTDDMDVTADLTSKVFLKSLKNIGSYKYQGVPFSAWLYKIALNEINMYFRQQKKQERTVSLEQHHVYNLIGEINYQEVDIDPEVIVTVLLEQLDDKEIQFIELRFFENHSFKEIGYLLGMSEVNAKIKTYRILKKLKKISTQINYNN